MSPWLFSVYMDAIMEEVKMRREESEDCLASCMQMIWFCVVSQKRPEGDGGTFCCGV